MAQQRRTRGRGQKRKAYTEPVKHSGSILNFVHFLGSCVPCPVCGKQVNKSDINRHLDSDCSNVETGQSFDNGSRLLRQKAVECTELRKSSKICHDVVLIEDDDDDDFETNVPNRKSIGILKTSPYFKHRADQPRTSRKNKSTTNNRIVVDVESRYKVAACNKLSPSSKSSSIRFAVESKMAETHSVSIGTKPADTNDGLSNDPHLTSSQNDNVEVLSASFQDCSDTGDLSIFASSSTYNDSSVKDEKQPFPPKIAFQKTGTQQLMASKSEELNMDSCDKYGVKNKQLASRCLLSKQRHNEQTLGSNDALETSANKDLLPKPHIKGNPCKAPLPSWDEMWLKVNEIRLNSAGDATQSYYLQNFLTALWTVFEEEEDRRLFNVEDFDTLYRFYNLSATSKKLYVRLFQRKWQWLRAARLNYPEIADDLVEAVDELVQMGFLMSEQALTDLQEALNVLSGPELRNLARKFHLQPPSGSSASRSFFMQEFQRLGRQQSMLSFAKATSLDTSQAILRRTREVLGRCVCLQAGPRAVLARALLLFSLPDSVEDEDAAGLGQVGQGSLFTILMVNMGRVNFPDYSVLRQRRVFRNRDDLLRFETSINQLSELMAAVSNGSWDEALHIYKKAQASWTCIEQDEDFSHERDLPVFLRCYTAGWVHVRLRFRGVEVLQRHKLYKEAVVELRSLLGQELFCPDSRGRWWDRLALNLHHHLKHTQEAIEAIQDGLMDRLVRTGHRLALQQRATRIQASAKSCRFRALLNNQPILEYQEAPKISIKGQSCPQMGMGKSVFLRPGSPTSEEDSSSGSATIMCSVEELVLAHFRTDGYDQGIHGEGSTFLTLFGLIAWDIVFISGIPDAFRSSYQAFPLDLYTDCFYSNRCELLQARLTIVEQASAASLGEMIAKTWETQQGRTSALVNWDRFESLEQAQELVACLGGPVLAGICRRLARDLRHCRAGLPDLVVWNSKSRKCKLIEVKGPGDRLSPKQLLWLDHLLKIGADAAVCHVEVVGARSARLTD
uniref:fanconi-associated nuclease 1 n=1 Tax=Myxine glutinosa TaxID=7769 RepID=UPI00358E825A